MPRPLHRFDLSALRQAATLWIPRRTGRHRAGGSGRRPAHAKSPWLSTGTPLRIGVVALGVAVSSVIAAASSYGASEPTYVVQPGDTLWSIAQEDGLTVAALASANDMSPDQLLLAGRTLVIPPRSAPGDGAGAAELASGAAGPGPSTPSACSAGGGPYGVLPTGLVDDGLTGLEPIFDRWAAVYGVSPALVEAIAWQESGWQQGVVSATGAIGIGQIEPATAEFIDADLIGEPLDVYSPADNIRMMTRFVAYLAAAEGGDLCATIAAYYEGAATLSGVGVLPETRLYVADVMGLLPRFE
jgi:LysM repeat protein